MYVTTVLKKNNHKMSKVTSLYPFFSLFFMLCFVSEAVHALQTDIEKPSSVSSISSADFINRSYTPTFDCPAPSLLIDINAILQRENLSAEQKLQLTSMRTHSLICAGKLAEAQGLLQDLLASEDANRSAKYYVSAVYQYGFIYDQQGNPERCNYYMLSRDAAKGKFSDIHVSATLGYVTECIKKDVTEQITHLYDVLESVTKMNDKAALAHAYNRVALFHSSINQASLAADQYVKAINIATGIYTDENLLTLYLNAFNASMLADNQKQAVDLLEKFIEINTNVGTPATNSMRYMMQARYQLEIEDFVSLESTLNAWDDIQKVYENQVYSILYQWNYAELCLHKNDMQCIQAFEEQESNNSAAITRYSQKSRDYLSLMTRIHVALGNTEEAQAIFRKYSNHMNSRMSHILNSSTNLGIAGLHQQINELENLLSEQENRRSLIMQMLIVALFVIGVTLAIFIKRKNDRAKAYDNVTGLLNNTAVLNKISHISPPGPKRTNALAVFDIANFTEVNLQLGSTKSDFVLKQIANTFKSITRSSDIIGHLGPAQFILCLADIEEEAAQAFFERAKEALSNTFSDHHHSKSISVDSSMSIYYSTESFSDLNEILNNMMLSLSMKAAAN